MGRYIVRIVRMNLTNLALLTQIALRDRQARISGSGNNTQQQPTLDVKRLLTELNGGNGLQLDNPAFYDLLCAPAQGFPSASLFIALEQATTQELKERATRDMLQAIRYGVPEVPLPEVPQVAPQAPNDRFRSLQETWDSLRQHIIDSCESSLPPEDPPAPDIPPAPFGALEGEAGGAFDGLEPLAEWEDPASGSGIDIFAEGGMPPLTSLSEENSKDGLALSPSPTFETIMYDEYERGIASFDAEKEWGYDDEIFIQ